MVFETSCWATATNDRPTMIDNNSVQRHPKIDYFDPNSVKAATPIISHISSNGYYGYCSMPYKTTNDTNNDFAMQDAIVDVSDDAMMHAQPTETGHQGKAIDRRKRTNQCNDDQYRIEFETKRSRIGFSDCIEDMQMCGAGDKMDVVDTFAKVDANRMSTGAIDNNNSTVNKAAPNNYFKSTMMTSHLI